MMYVPALPHMQVEWQLLVYLHIRLPAVTGKNSAPAHVVSVLTHSAEPQVSTIRYWSCQFIYAYAYAYAESLVAPRLLNLDRC